MAHGLTAVREMFLDRYAEVFATAGFTTLVYDHFGFGSSDGEPRQCPSPSLQLEGYRDAVAWLGRQASVDAGRIGLWGSSFSGGEVIILAAEDLPIACAVAQVPALAEGGPGLPTGALAAVTEALEQGRDDLVLPATTATPDGDGVMFEDGAHDWFARVSAERAPTWRNEVRVSGLLEPFRPIDHLAGAKVPLLLLVAPADALTPPGPATAVAAATPLVEVVEASPAATSLPTSQGSRRPSSPPSPSFGATSANTDGPEPPPSPGPASSSASRSRSTAATPPNETIASGYTPRRTAVIGGLSAILFAAVVRLRGDPGPGR